MRRRKLLKQIGASSAIAIGATGFAAQPSGAIPLSEANYITTEINGEVQDLTLEEFDKHPDTKSLSDFSTEACCYECKECCDACCPDTECCFGGYCGSCSGC